MAAIYRKKSPLTGKPLANFYCFFRLPDGKQVHRATGKTTKKEAADAAVEIERDALKEAGAGDERSAAILAKVREASELAMRGRLNPSRARALIAEIVEISSGEKLSEFTVKGWVDEWLREKRTSGALATAAAYSTATKLFLASLGEKSSNHLDSITATDIRVFRDSIRAKGRTAKTANIKLKIIRSCFADAVRAHAVTSNPATAVKSLPEDDSTKREPFTLDEAVKLLASAPSSDWRGLMLVALFTGIRLGDAARLKAGNIDLKKGVVTLVPGKTKAKGRKLEIPLHDEVLAFFEEHPLPAFAAAPVFPSLASRKVGGKQGLSIEFGVIMDTAKVPRMRSRSTEDGAARMMSQRSFHSFRHTTTSLMANAGVAPEMRMSITGHSTNEAHQGYTHLELAPMREAVDRMPSLPRKASAKGRRKPSA